MEKVIKTYVKRPVRPNHNLLCCRACLATDGKLYNMHEYNLVDAFTRISGITVKTDKLPQHLCSWCVMLLRRCNEFRARCDRAKLCLLTSLMTGNVSMDYIRSIDRIANRLVNLQTTQVKTVQYPDITQLENVTEEQTINMDNEEFLPNIDVANTENNKGKYLIKLSDLNTDYESENDAREENVFIVKDIEEIKNKNLDDEIKVHRPIIKISRPRKKKIVNVQTFDEAGKKIRKWKRKKKPKKGQRTAENDYLPVIDFEKFQSTYRVKFIILTEEEQLQELEMRKASPKYLEAAHRCSDCAKIFRAEAAYNYHRAKHDPSIGDYSCPICALRFRTKSFREKHRDRHRLKFVCRVCGFVLRNVTNAKYHHDMHANKTTQCHHCGMVFRNYSTHMNHQRLAHADLNVACNLCGETFVGRRGLLNHKSITHNVKEQEPKCDVCSASFVSLEAMKRHADTGEHAGHPCRMCGRDCASAEMLRAHAADEHPTCDLCRETFVDAAAFATHARRKHVARGFRQRGPRARGPHGCSHCGKTVASVAALEQHVRQHTGVKPFGCATCGRHFSIKGNLELHKRTHTGVRPYQCDHCSLAFSTKNNLKRHILAVHMGMTTPNPCNICGRSLSTPSMLQVHLRRVHGGEPWPKRDPVTRKVIRNVPDDS